MALYKSEYYYFIKLRLTLFITAPAAI